MSSKAHKNLATGAFELKDQDSQMIPRMPEGGFRKVGELPKFCEGIPSYQTHITT